MPLTLYTIYKNPPGYPEKFVVLTWRFRSEAVPPRCWHEPDEKPFAICDSVEEARAAIPKGMVALTRMHNDEGNILESWI